MSQSVAKAEINVFAKTNFRNKEVAFGVKKDDRRRHMYIIGKTGMGKTTMIENMIVQDIIAGHGICFVDPHGESVEKILNYVPPSRVNDIVYFNPADLDYPIAFNPLESVDPKYKHLVASGLMGVFTKIWANVWSARMEYILNNTILALLDTPGNTMLGIARMLVDKKFRKKIVDNVRDPIVKSFWIDEFANYNDKFRNEAIAPIQNKVGQFLSSAVIRNIVGQTKSTIDLRDIMDNKKILLLNLSKGRIGEDNSALLGAMFITKVQLAAMSRVDVPEDERKDFYLYVDEFQNFATESFATILSEARKYRLNLVIAHQYIGQLITETGSTKIKDAVFGNVGTMIIFRIGATDAEELETEFDPTFTPNDMVNLTKYHIYLKLMINGVSSTPFSATTLPPLAEKTGTEEKIIRVSRERYGKGRDQIEEKITRWMGQEYHQSAAQQDLTIEETEAERGGVIFTGKTSPGPQVQQVVEIPKPIMPPKPQVAPTPKIPVENPIWSKVAQDAQKKSEENVKKKLQSLVFKFGDGSDEKPAPMPQNPLPAVERVEEMLKKLQEKVQPKPVEPGQTVKF
ncbi:MAG: type IV secretion system DNA-binding domain-containing protein [bacterium]|nr:type IV secretion system DNA-binding domain-containing protein [bacterium]